MRDDDAAALKRFHARLDTEEKERANLFRIRFGGTILVCAIIALAGFCAAGHADGQSLSGSLAWYAVPIGADQITTELALDRGGHEMNATLRGPLSKRIAMATAETYALAWSDAALCRSGKRKWAWALRIGAAIFYGRAAVHNFRELRR